MKDKVFALGSYEFELQSKTEQHFILSKFRNKVKYIDTAIDYNNDYILTSKVTKGYKIISKISFCHYSNYEFFVSNHLKCLGRDNIDIMLIHSNRGEWIDLAKRINEDNRFIEVGVSNFTKEDILKYKEVVGKFPAYNEIEINPYYLNKETIDFCKDNEIKIIAYAILGGKYASWRNVADFGLPNLISFAANYSDIIIIRPNSLREALEFNDIITNYKSIETIESVALDNKTIEPMNYKIPSYTKTYLGKLTYHTACGKNIGQLKEKILDISLPSYEMLGDYKVYIRYLFRQDYSDISKNVYDYDFLIGDDNNYYVVYLYDEEGRLTKVNHNSKIEVKRYEL